MSPHKQPTRCDGQDVERIARIIEPWAWDHQDDPGCTIRRDYSLQRARTILATLHHDKLDGEDDRSPYEDAARRPWLERSLEADRAMQSLRELFAADQDGESEHWREKYVSLRERVRGLARMWEGLAMHYRSYDNNGGPWWAVAHRTIQHAKELRALLPEQEEEGR